MMEKERIKYIDFAAGIMILWMIVYHAIIYSWSFDLRNYWAITDLSLLPQNAHAFINSGGKLEMINPCVLFPYLSFFMPWFFYKSGYFFDKCSKRILFIKDSQKLLLNFAIWSGIGYVFFVIFGYLQHVLTLRGATYTIARGLFLTGTVPVNEPLWFLLSLFGVRFLANIIMPEKGEQYAWWKVAAIVLAGSSISYACYVWNHRLLPYWIANITTGLIFFVLGYWLREYEKKWWVIVSCTLVYLACCLFGFPVVDMMYNKLLSGSYILWIPVSICGIVVFNSFCRLCSRYIQLIPIEMVGKNAMNIYVTHILIVCLCRFVIDYFDQTQCFPYLFWIIMCCYLLVLPLCCYVIPRISKLVGNCLSIPKY